MGMIEEVTASKIEKPLPYIKWATKPNVEIWGFDLFYLVVAAIVFLLIALPLNAPQSESHWDPKLTLIGLGIGAVATATGLLGSGAIGKRKWGPGLSWFVVAPAYKLISHIKYKKALKIEAESSIAPYRTKINPSTQSVAWQLMYQKAKLTMIRENLRDRISATKKKIHQIESLNSTSLLNNPTTQQLLKKLYQQVEEMDNVDTEAWKQISAIGRDLYDLETRISAINEYQTVVDGIQIAEANDLLIQEANQVITDFNQVLTGREQALKEIQTESLVLTSTVKELPEVYAVVS